MKLGFLLLFFLPLISVAQYPGILEKTAGIAADEAHAHQRLYQTEGQSLASANFNVHYYRLEWDVDPAVRYITGKVTSYFTITAASSSITFDMLNPLICDSVKQRGVSLSFTQTTNTIDIRFPSAFSTGQSDSVSIYYHGVPANTGFGSFIQSSHAGVPITWSLSEPYGARDWWPCKNGLDDKTDSIDVFITHPVAYKAASNGLLQSETLLPGGLKKRTWWQHRYPIATYLICFAVTNYSVFTNSVMLGNISMPMQTFCYPENLDLFVANTPMVLQAMQLFNRNFGEYPFIKEKYGHVQFGWGGGMEHQTSTFLVTPDESLMAHELGHQWFGDKITTGSWEDIWLNEGFATFLAAFYMETQHPDTRIANRRTIVNAITSAPGGSVRVDDTTNVNRIFSSRLSYNKGSYLLNMLRFMMGDTIFFKAMQKYQQDPSVIYGFARTTDFKRIMERESGMDLTTFFNQWFYGEGYPSYKVTWKQLGASNVQITMNQVTSHPSVSFFKMPVALSFRKGTQEKTVIVNNTQDGQTFLANIGFVADTVLVDPEIWLISRNNTTAKIPTLASGNGAVDIRSASGAGLLQLYIHDFNASAATITVYNAAGQLLLRRDAPLINGTEFIEIPVNSWPKGIYVVRSQVGSQLITQRFLR